MNIIKMVELTCLFTSNLLANPPEGLNRGMCRYQVTLVGWGVSGYRQCGEMGQFKTLVDFFQLINYDLIGDMPVP